jgi:hypothetical protein
MVDLLVSGASGLDRLVASLRSTPPPFYVSACEGTKKATSMVRIGSRTFLSRITKSPLFYSKIMQKLGAGTFFLPPPP